MHVKHFISVIVHYLSLWITIFWPNASEELIYSEELIKISKKFQFHVHFSFILNKIKQFPFTEKSVQKSVHRFYQYNGPKISTVLIKSVRLVALNKKRWKMLTLIENFPREKNFSSKNFKKKFFFQKISKKHFFFQKLSKKIFFQFFFSFSKANKEILVFDENFQKKIH